MFKLKNDTSPGAFDRRKAGLLEQMQERHATAQAMLSAKGKEDTGITEAEMNLAAEIGIRALDATMETLQDYIDRGVKVLNGDAARSMFTAEVLSIVGDQVKYIMHDMMEQALEKMLNNVAHDALKDLTNLPGIKVFTMEDFMREIGGDWDPEVQ